MDSLGGAAVALYAFVSVVLLVRLWRRDVFFASFFTSVVLYSIVAQVGYLLFPALSEFAILMYFGPEVLPRASLFATLSLLALYGAYGLVYRPLVDTIIIPTRRRRPSRVAYPLIVLAHAFVLAIGYAYFGEQLSYLNAADEGFIESAGLPYKLFWAVFKFSPYVLIVQYAVIRQGLLVRHIEGQLAPALFLCGLSMFLLIAGATGSRTDPLALVLGTLAFEYFRHAAGRRDAPQRRGGVFAALRRQWRFLVAAAAMLALTVALLTQLEASRGGKTGDVDADISAFVQALLLKDYYTPFHVLIGAIANDYVDPVAVLASNAANALMFLKVPYLQSYIVELWNPGSVTRAASPAMFAFTEGFVALGWAGWAYNGIVWALGYALWRSLSRTDNDDFNALAFAIPMAMVMVAARSQSSYFIKTLYLSYLPALLLYSLASGIRWKWPLLSRGRARRAPAASGRVTA